MNEMRKSAREIVSQLTLKEKIGQIAQIEAGYRCYNLTENGGVEFTEEFKSTVEEYGGIGAISGILRADPWSGRYYGTGIEIEMREKFANMLQKYIEENTRMKIPAMIEVEASHGLQALGSVMYPTGLSNAASFNPSLYGRMMEEIGREIEASGNHIAFLTLIDLARDPRWGRSEECLGENPYLAARMAEAAVRGIKKSNVLACAKHFTAAGDCEGGINCGNVNMGRREFDRVSDTARACVDAGCDLIMAAYNSVDGIPIHTDATMLTEKLRGEMGFDGVVISDGSAVRKAGIVLGTEPEDAAILCIKAGIDLSLGDERTFTELEGAVRSGKLDEEYIDRACERVIAKKLELGLFEKRYVEEGLAKKFNSDGHCEKIAYELAAESITMIKNNGVLPMDGNMRLAVIGENANDIYHILGDYTSERKAGEGITVSEAIKDRFPNAVFEQGWNYNGDKGIEPAMKAAENADVIVFCAGGTSRRDLDATYLDNGAVSESKNYMDCGEGVDLASLELPRVQLELLECLKETGKPIVTVVTMGRGYILTELEKLSDAVLVAWYPGQEGGRAIADILSGEVNPSGKLPITLPRRGGVFPLYRGGYAKRFRYADCEKPILHPFGYGLSYSEFEYYGLCVTTTREGISVSFGIKNMSDTIGKETAQLYFSVKGDSVIHENKRLMRFSKVEIKPHENIEMKFLVKYDELRLVKPIAPCVEITVGEENYEKFDTVSVNLEKIE